MRATVPLVALAAGVMTAVAACTDDGRALREPSPDQTTSTVSTVAPADPGSGPAVTASSVPIDPMRLSSPTIAEAGTIPDDYTCWGRDVSPPLRWGPVPPDTVELALVVRDVDAGGFVHWVITGLPPSTGGLAEGTVPAGAEEALNDFGRPGWAGPCPTDDTHNYEFRLYALAQPSGVTQGQPGAQAASQVEATAARMSAVLSGSASPQ